MYKFFQNRFVFGYVAALFSFLPLFSQEITPLIKKEFPAATHSNAVLDVHYFIDSEPDWVKNYISIKELEDGAQQGKNETEGSLLIANQIDLESKTYHSHTVKYISNEVKAQEASCFDISFDPSYEKIILHELSIYRKNKKIDCLGKVKFQIIQQEGELSKYLYNGQLSLVAILSDIRVGDVIDLRYSVVGFNPIMKDLFFGEFLNQTSIETKRLVNRFIIPTNRKISYQFFGNEKPLIINSISPEKEEWVIDNLNPLPVKSKTDLPSWKRGYDSIQLTEFKSWKECVEWARKLFVIPNEKSEELISLIQEVQDQSHNKVDQAVFALRYVQNTVRYLGIENGESSHLPKNPNDTLSQGYGDCKDKTLLLHTILHELNIESYPCLVSTKLLGHFENELPNPFAFNHAILLIVIDGKNYFVDPTVALEKGSLSNLGTKSYRSALVLRPDASGFTEIQEDPSLLDIMKTTTFEASDHSPTITILIDEVISGNRAVSVRRMIQTVGLDKAAKIYLDLDKLMFNEIEIINAPTFEDNQEKGEISIRRKYSSSKMWIAGQGKKEKVFMFYPLYVGGELKSISFMNGEDSGVINYPSRIKERFIVQGINKKSYKGNAPKKTMKTDAAFLQFNYNEPNTSTQVYDFDYMSMKDYVDVGEIDNHKKIVQDFMGKNIIQSVKTSNKKSIASKKRQFKSEKKYAKN